ncbi:11507_t:CDS:2 [Gigaspora margarita]|uniref:11507_t:CDS:1 n=1 Tax=Gigaspora margarita TaxID=4874 RepID=A0ABN7UR03_GIGMA|nr:11507_t:CDS:2 [Gigaspora margarita]
MGRIPNGALEEVRQKNTKNLGEYQNCIIAAAKKTVPCLQVKKTVKAKRQKIAIAKAAIALGKLIHEVKRNRISAKCLLVEVWNNQIRRINHLAKTKDIWQHQGVKLDKRVWRSNVTVNTIEQYKNLDLIFDMLEGSWHLQGNGPTIISMLDSKMEKQSKQTHIDLGLFFIRQLLDCSEELLIDDTESRKVKEDLFSNDINTSALQPHCEKLHQITDVNSGYGSHKRTRRSGTLAGSPKY